MSAPQVEFFFSFRSPYSYLAAPRIYELADRWEIDLVYRGVRPMVTRGVPLPRAKQLYIVRDAAREARRIGMPFGRIHDPLGSGALRCLNVAEHAATKNKQRAFVLRASRAIWAEGLAVEKDDPLRAICDEVGLKWDECREAVRNTEYSARIESNIARLHALGHWGVPTLAWNGRLYWGQDRIVDLEADFERAGVALRSS